VLRYESRRGGGGRKTFKLSNRKTLSIFLDLKRIILCDIIEECKGSGWAKETWQSRKISQLTNQAFKVIFSPLFLMGKSLAHSRAHTSWL
jgi:hypothetical protein